MSRQEFRFGEQITVGGFRCDEVASALQKTTRRGEERQAIFWASELDLSGYGNYAWKRLKVITSEDVGLAWSEGPAVIRALHENWVEIRKAERDRPPEKSNGMLYIVHATLLLARAPKSRIVDNAANVMYAGDRVAMGFEIPDYAVDHHTARGRAMGRSEATVYSESYKLVGQALEDPYEDEARAIDTRRSRISGQPPLF